MIQSSISLLSISCFKYFFLKGEGGTNRFITSFILILSVSLKLISFWALFFSYIDNYWNQCKLVLWGIPVQAFSLSSDSNASLSRKNLTKQLILTEQDQFLCQCEAAISIQQQPLQADWLTYQWFWQMSKRKSRRRRPLSTVYIFLYIFKLRFNLHSHLSFDSFL